MTSKELAAKTKETRQLENNLKQLKIINKAMEKLALNNGTHLLDDIIQDSKFADELYNWIENRIEHYENNIISNINV